MRFPRPRKARTRIALTGAALSAALLLLLGALVFRRLSPSFADEL